MLLFTVESEPEDLPEKLPFVTLDSMTHISYPGKKVAYPSFHNLWLIFQGLREHNVDFVHMSNDGFSHMFAMAGLLLGVRLFVYLVLVDQSNCVTILHSSSFVQLSVYFCCLP